MIAALLLAAAAPSAVDAERAFAAMAQTAGQWTAFRAFAAPDAVMFVPQPTNAQSWLKDRADPPSSVMWWPAKVVTSCDGLVSVTTGSWIRAGGKSAGYFTTVWTRQTDGSWKWVLDHGDDLARPRPTGETVEVRNPECGKAAPPPTAPLIGGIRSGDTRTMGASVSPDRTLSWVWSVAPDGSRKVEAAVWNGGEEETILVDEVAAQ